MKILIILSNKIDLLKRFVDEAAVIFLSPLKHALHQLTEVMANNINFIDQSLNRFIHSRLFTFIDSLQTDKSFELFLKTRIIPNQTAITTTCTFLLSLIAGTVLIISVIRLLKFFKSYVIILKGRLFIFSGQVKAVFSKGLYSRIFAAMDKFFATLMMDILDELWLRIRYISFFKNPFILRYKVEAFQKKISAFLSPFFKKTVQLIDRFAGNKKEEGELFPSIEETSGLTKGKQLPEELLTLFRNSDIITDIYSEPLANMLTSIIERWEKGTPSGLFLTGPPGSGKTTFLKLLLNKFSSYPVHYHKLQRNGEQSGIEFLKSLRLHNRQMKQIILLDDIECLFLKKIGGFENINYLLHLISTTKPEILWIVSANSSFFYFLKNIYPMEAYFPFIHELSGCTIDQLYDILEEKVKSLNYKIRIIPDEPLKQTVKKRLKRKSLSFADVPGYIKNRYFEKYIETGGSNFYFHQFYFLRAIKSILNNTLLIASPSFPEFPGIKNLEMEFFFILQAFAIHKELSSSEISEILLLTEERVEQVLSFFHSYNIIEKQGFNYIINPTVYPEIARWLNLKNLHYGRKKA